MSDKEMQLKRAKTSLIAHDYETAKRIYKSLISEDPDNLELKIQLGNLYVKSGEDEMALTCFEEIDNLQPGNVDVLLALGGIYRRLERYEDSIFALERAIDTGEKGIQISYSLGFTYRQMGKYSSAIECFQSVVDQNPRDVLAFNHLGAIYALQNNHEKAISTYLHGLKLDPNHPVLQLNIAKSMEVIGENKKALSYYEGALRSKPGWTEAIDGYANLLLKDNQVQEADNVVSRALKINPDDVKMHTAMGKVYNRKSVFDHAEQEFKKALSKNDKYSPALTGLAFSQEQQGKHSEAAETIQKATKISPEDVSILKQSANILLSANYLSAAYEKISHLWKIDQNDVETVNLLGQYYIVHGDEDKIEACFDRIERVKPDYTDVYRDWGKRYYQIADLKNAEDYLKVAVHENSKDSDALLQLARVYENQGKDIEALNILGKARKVDGCNAAVKKAVEQIEQKEHISSEDEIADADMDMNADFIDDTGFDTEISLANDGETDAGLYNPVMPSMEDRRKFENKNAGAESPIDFDADAEIDRSVEYDPNRSLENLIDTEHDNVDSVIPHDVDSDVEHPANANPYASNPSGAPGAVPSGLSPVGAAPAYSSDGAQPVSASAHGAPSSAYSPSAPASVPSDSDEMNVAETADSVPSLAEAASENENFDFNQFGTEDLSGDTDDLVSIDEIMSGDPEIDSKNPNENLIDIDVPVDEDDDEQKLLSEEREMNLAEIADAATPKDDYGFEDENVNPPKENPRAEPKRDFFKSEDISANDRSDEPVYIPENTEKPAPMPNQNPVPPRENESEPRQYDARHQPKPISDDDYLSLERQIQRVSNSADNAAYTANQAWRAAQFANDFAQNAADKIKKAERNIEEKIADQIDDKLDGVDRKIKNRIDNLLEKKFSENFDEKIEDKIKEKIGDDLYSKISETIDNFVVTPDAELYNSKSQKEVSDVIEEEDFQAEMSKQLEEKASAEIDEEIKKLGDLGAPSEADMMLKKAVDTLPSIVAAIANKDVAEEFSTSLDMFKKLRDMLEFLPPAKKKQFMTSHNRLMLDYIIAKLSGKPGLFATISALIESGIVARPTPTEEITSDIAMDPSDDENIIALVSTVMQTLRNLCENLEDDYLRDALDSEILELLEKIKS
ncbi:MAG: tetratricopeptide repeat protein [Treponema sp.]|nr:tetratricopeptide repeat protein [Treponema sp.]